MGTHVFLSLGGVALCSLHNSLGRASGVMSGKITKLSGLLGDDVAGVVDMMVDELLVGDVHEGRKVHCRDGDQTEAPGRNNLDQEVGQERCAEGLDCRSDEVNGGEVIVEDIQLVWPIHSRRRVHVGTQ